MLLALKGDIAHLPPQLGGKVKAVNGGKEKKRPHPLVEIPSLPAKPIELDTFLQEFRQRKLRTGLRQRSIAYRRILTRDDVQELGHPGRE